MGRGKRNGNYSPHKNKLVQDSEGSEENRYPVPNSNKTKINYTKEPNVAQQNILKEEILQVINENFIECYQTWSTKTYRRNSRNSKTRKIKNMRKQRNK
jgi:hypothetical protein